MTTSRDLTITQDCSVQIGKYLTPGLAEVSAHSDDADHRFRQADRRFQAMPITVEERRSIGALGVGVEG